jgi:hypothetical protein
VAWLMSVSGAVVGSMAMLPAVKAMSCRRIREVPVPEQYSPGRSRKKKASQARSTAAWMVGLGVRAAVAVMRCSTWIGRGFTRAGGGSALA